MMNINGGEQFEVFFRKPDHEPGLSDKVNLALAMGAIASRLTQEERTRTYHPDGRRENVAEHSLMLVKVATYLAKEFYPSLDAGKVAIIAANHDDVEAYALDTATDRITEEERQLKAAREAYGLRVLQNEYSDVSPTYVRDVTAYEELLSPEDEFVKVIDKWMVLLIHVPNEGASLLANYSHEEYLERTYAEAARLHALYRRFPELIDARTELALHLGGRFYLDRT